MYQYRSMTKGDWTDLQSTGSTRLHTIGLKGKVAFGAFLIISCLYFWYRLPLWNPEASVLSSLLLVAEGFGVLTLILHVFSTWTLVERVAPTPPPGFQADIFITTWNEPPELLRRTIVAAKQVRLARNIWLLDDGCRPTMAQLARELKVRYIAREDRSHAKAGNLNNALQHSDAEFIALFDCDHAPGPEFLERTLGHFQDANVAFVQTPQDFFNVDSFQHRGSAHTQEAWHEQTLFYRVIQAGKDRWNATFFCGSCAVLRRKSLDDIGGFATGTITEDMHTSLRMHKNGWSAVYHAEALAFGLSPVSFEQYETQRLRWGRGAMQVWAKEGILTANNLTLAQRLAYFTSAVTYFEGWQKAIIYTLPMIVLATGSMPLIWTGLPFIMIFLLWLTSGMIVNELFSRGYAKTFWMEQYNFIRYFTFMRATMSLFVPKRLRFAVTPKGMQNGSSDLARLWPQIAVLAGAVGAGFAGCYLYSTRQHLPQGAFIANLFWLTFNAFLAASALAFVLRKTRQRRGAYRFQLPAVVRVSFQAKDCTQHLTTIAEDISSNGLSFAVDRETPAGTPLTGTLLLPTGPLMFNGTVRRYTGDTTTGGNVGVEFDWHEGHEADVLSSYLYGNTLQWDVNAWAETSKLSPRRYLTGLTAKKRASESKWAFSYLVAAGQSVDCLSRIDATSIRLLSYEALPGECDLSLEYMDGTAIGNLRVIEQRQYAFGDSTMILAVLAVEQIQAKGFHREPLWARMKVHAHD